MHISLAYGRGTRPVEMPAETVVIEPRDQPGLPDERAELLRCLEQPIGAPALSTRCRPGARVCLVHTDSTRATPNQRLIPWLLDFLEEQGIRREDITLLNALGSHRPDSRAQLEELLTAPVVETYRCLNHEPENRAAHGQVGWTRTGAPALLNRHLLEADVRIITGFIEPHFFAGFSGGPKGIMPGVAALETIQANHGAANIGDPRATFGSTEGNPIWEEMKEIALRAGESFLVNVTLNHRRQITAVFAGDLVQAHRQGIEHVRASAMQPQAAPFDVVLTTNSGYPLDRNLYQGVKGMRAAERIVRDGGHIILAAECADGFPDGSPYEQLLRSVSAAEEVLQRIATPGFLMAEQWQSQIQALVQRRATVHLYSALPDEAVRAAHLVPCPDISTRVRELMAQAGPRVAVLPQGPLTIPYLTA